MVATPSSEIVTATKKKRNEKKIISLDIHLGEQSMRPRSEWDVEGGGKENEAERKEKDEREEDEGMKKKQQQQKKNKALHKGETGCK